MNHSISAYLYTFLEMEIRTHKDLNAKVHISKSITEKNLCACQGVNG